MKSLQLQMFQIYLSFDPNEDRAFAKVLQKDTLAYAVIAVHGDEDTRINVLRKQRENQKEKEIE